MKRGLGTALLTGGLLAVGTGVASADDDKIAVTAPLTVAGNSLAVVGDAAATGNAGHAGGEGGDDPAVAVTAPVTVTGTSVAVVGDAVSTGSTGRGSGTADGGSVVDLDVPVTVCGTAVGVVGDARAGCGTSTGSSGGAGGGGSGVDADVPVTVPGTVVDVLGDEAAGCGWDARMGAPTGSGSPLRAERVCPLRETPARLSLLAHDGVAPDAPGAGGARGELAYTGTSFALPLLAGLLALASGLCLTAAARRRPAGSDG